MSFEIRVAVEADIDAIRLLIARSVRCLQVEYTEAEREAALLTVFTVDSRLIADGTYFVAFSDGMLAGCGGWSYRRTLYGGDSQVEDVDEGVLESMLDAAKIRAIFVHPEFARKGLGSLLLEKAEAAARLSGFRRVEMGSTLAGVWLYLLKGYTAGREVSVPVGRGLTITILKMEKMLSLALPDLRVEDQAELS